MVEQKEKSRKKDEQTAREGLQIQGYCLPPLSKDYRSKDPWDIALAPHAVGFHFRVGILFWIKLYKLLHFTCTEWHFFFLV